MRHLRTHAASVAIIAGLGILGVGCTDDDDPTVDETTDTTDAPTTEAPTTEAPTGTESPTS